MKAFLRNDFILVVILFIVWKVFLLLVEFLSVSVPVRMGYLGPSPWANFDGVHYLLIARYGYLPSLEAFFPLFPILVRVGSFLFSGDYLLSATLISILSLISALFFFLKITQRVLNRRESFWSVIFLLSFPTAFYLNAVYTESIFLFFVFGFFYFLTKRKKSNKNLLIASLFGALASATRVVGIFLLFSFVLETYKKKISLWLKIIYSSIISIGLLSYMGFLWLKFKDPLLFVHQQSGFNAGRTGGKIILLPQVLFRYLKIFLNVSVSNYDFWIALLELSVFLLTLIVLILSLKKKFPKSFMLFSFFCVLFPTLSGTLLSIPRFSLVSFPIFMYFATIRSTYLRYTIFLLSFMLEIVLVTLFLRGYFVS